MWDCLILFRPSRPNIPHGTVPNTSTIQLTHPVRMYHTWWDGTSGDCPKHYSIVPLVHPVPMYQTWRDGTTWDCPKHYSISIVKIVHPVPMYMYQTGRDGTSWDYPKHYSIVPLVHSIRPQCTKRDEIVHHGTVPNTIALSLLSIPSQCTKQDEMVHHGTVPNTI